MNINHLIEFIYLAETLSFRKTADYFYVSRSVISRHLAALEETIGVKLVERGNQSVQLTDAGKVFHREAQTVLRTYATAIDRTREAGKATEKTVHIGYLKNAARPVIVRFARFMGHEHPDIRLDLTCMGYGELRHALEDGAVDVALAVNVQPRISRNYRSTQIYTDRFYAIMSRDHPLAERSGGISMDDLAQERLLLPDTFAYAGLSEFIDKLVESKNRAAGREYYSDIDTLYLKVQTEHFVAFSSGLNNAMFGDKLAILPLVGIDTSFKVSAFYNDNFVGGIFNACREGFESCQKALASSDGPSTELEVFSLADFD
jgi:DNA-binding transcriptional LysR family regulator